MRQTEIVLLRWSCDVVASQSGLQFLTLQNKFDDFAKLQFQLLNAVALTDHKRSRDTAQIKFIKSLQMVPPSALWLSLLIARLFYL